VSSHFELKLVHRTSLFPDRVCFSLLPFLLPRRNKKRERERARDGRVALIGFEKRERES